MRAPGSECGQITGTRKLVLKCNNYFDPTVIILLLIHDLVQESCYMPSFHYLIGAPVPHRGDGQTEYDAGDGVVRVVHGSDQVQRVGRRLPAACVIKVHYCSVGHRSHEFVLQIFKSPNFHECLKYKIRENYVIAYWN